VTGVVGGAHVDLAPPDDEQPSSGGAGDDLRLSFEDVDGARVAVWWAGDPGASPLVLVHGNGANHAWWAAMIPLLAPHHRVAAVELSGYGRSDHRSRYSWQTWAAEVAAVVRAVGAPATVVGHSMGGVVAAVAAAAYPSLVERLVVFDAYPRPRGVQRRPEPPPPRRYYRDREELVARFRLRPAQELPAPELTRLLVDATMKETPSGWTWRSDPAARGDWADPVIERLVTRIHCPTTWVFSEHSEHLHAQAAQRIVDESSGPYVMASVPRTHHHLILEEPAACSALLDLT
jgi:pimeloyl-ACP methyl ester carboxylesterase